MDFSDLRRPTRSLTSLFHGIRPELDLLQPYVAKAAFARFAGVALNDLSRQELLALAAMFCERECLKYQATEPNPEGPQG